MESVLARAEMAPAMVYMVRTVLFSKKARSLSASSEGRSQFCEPVRQLGEGTQEEGEKLHLGFSRVGRAYFRQ